MSAGTVDGLWDEFENEVEIDFVFLFETVNQSSLQSVGGGSKSRIQGRHTFSPLE